MNDKSDQPFDGTWGISPYSIEDLNYYIDDELDIKFSVGYRSYNKYRYWNADDPKFLDYKLDLPAGEYVITTGHYAWHGIPNAPEDPSPDEPMYGNWPRDLQVWFGEDTRYDSGIEQHWLPDDVWKDTFKEATYGTPPVNSYQYFDEIGQSRIFTHNPYIHNGGLLSVRVEAVNMDGSSLTFIGVQKLGEAEDEIVGVYGSKELHAAAYPGETDALPANVSVLRSTGSISSAAVSWNYELITGDKLYRTVNLTGTIEGYDAEVLTAVVEVIPRGLVYYIDTATAGQYDRGPDSAFGPNYSLQRDDNINGSASFDAVKAKLGSSLLNNRSDKLFYGSESNPAQRWGIVEDSVQCISGYVEGAEPPELRFRVGYTSWNSIERPEQDPPGHEFYPKYQIGRAHV
jgi:hypothetical protein